MEGMEQTFGDLRNVKIRIDFSIFFVNFVYYRDGKIEVQKVKLIFLRLLSLLLVDIVLEVKFFDYFIFRRLLFGF